ncbi:MAG: HAMP domain-containing protein [bacterium]|nr:HAMP domain-containing protein [bacterium]
MRLSIKLTIVTTTALVILLGVTSVLVFRFSQREFKQVINQQRFERVTLIANGIDVFMRERLSELRVMTAFVEGGSLTAQLTKTPQWTAFAVMDSEGNISDSSPSGSFASDAVQEQLRLERSSSQSGLGYASEVFRGGPANQPIVLMVVPLPFGDQEKYQLVGLMDWNFVADFIQATYTDLLYLFDSSGNIIAETDPAAEMALFSGFYEPKIVDFALRGSSDTTVLPSGTNYLSDVLLARATMGEREYFVGPTWSLVLESSTYSAYFSVQRTIFFVGIILLVSLIIVLYFIGSWMHIHVARPIVSLTKTVRRITYDEDFHERSTVHSKDEIGTLAAAINDLVTKIQLKMNSLGKPTKKNSQNDRPDIQ